IPPSSASMPRARRPAALLPLRTRHWSHSERMPLAFTSSPTTSSQESIEDSHCKTKIWKMRVVLQPKTMQKIGTLLAIAWPDGQETYLPLETLRRACPCASCGGEPDVLGRLIRPEVRYSQASFDLKGWEAVGGYG